MRCNFLFFILIAVLLTGCGQERRVVGDYRMERFKNDNYYLHKAHQDDSAEGGSILGGVVVKIGWSDRYIVAKRYSIYRGDPDGWMIIDVQTGVMRGPFNEGDFQMRPESKGIKIYDADEAWKRL